MMPEIVFVWRLRRAMPADLTRCAISNAQNSSKSGASSKVLPPQKLDGGHPFGRWTASPVGEIRVRPALLGKRRHR